MGQVWMERLMRWNAKLQHFLKGRYARMDQLNKTMLIGSIVLIIANSFLPTSVLRWIGLALIVFIYYRFLSKRIYVRANENTKYLKIHNRIFGKIKKIKLRFQQRKIYKYFTCPSCKQSLRAPKGKGQIKVTCSKCHQQFSKKV
ncbi:hypothetical protein [Enterococcus rivorum]|uniref:Zn-finger containing protein n=1 Tax=Enterococcus rivorum TaxID=762845 RepID=A0A1E5KYP1_9ENTE|nr:hypothetical protein [Enterococcus rivorum]MBP2097473.1 putative paraquat-inducible protein A [Enterococcus rivorum]OEH82933.1 hypothetical protein BCR26_01265 [Enterococcus rivorum]